jgi:hypothetical protein
MRTNGFCLTIAALLVAVATTACTDSPDPVAPVGSHRPASPPQGPNLIGLVHSANVEFVDGEGKLDLTDVKFEFPEGVTAGASIVVTGNYEIKSIPACGGCNVTAYIGLSYDASELPGGATANFVIAETDGSNLPLKGSFTWTTRLRKTSGYTLIGAGQVASSEFTPTTPGHEGPLDLRTGETLTTLGWWLLWQQVVHPGIFPIVAGTPGTDGWYRSDVNLSWDVFYPHTGGNTKNGCDPVTLIEDTTGQTIECSATSFLYTNSRSITIKRDATRPSLENLVVAPSPNANGWSRGTVTLSWECRDATSGPQLESHTEAFTEGIYLPRAVCTDNAGNRNPSELTRIRVDNTAPTLSPSVSPDPITQNESATALPNADDALSGVASSSCDPVVTSQAGTFSVTCQATDIAGNTATKSVSYVVKSLFNFSGFQSPIVPGTLNSRSAGAAVAVKFSVGGDKGLNILAAGSPTSRLLTCPAGATVTTVSETTASSNGGGLQYDARTDTYTYVWKTEKAWAGTCRTLVLKLTDGIERTADFQFKK